MNWDSLHWMMKAAKQDGVFPGYALEIYQNHELLWQDHGGQAELLPLPRPVVKDTPWDLASLTKVIATTTLCMRLYASGRLDLEAPVAHWLSGVDPQITVSHLLQHSSGLPAWRALFKEFAYLPPGTPSTRAALLEKVRSTPLQAPPGTQHRYSDLGFMLLGALLEEIGQDRLDRLVIQEVCVPLSLDLRWGWPGAAATEDCPMRRSMISGQVHDLNAWWLGGIAPHAGLFATVSQVSAFANALLKCWQGQGPIPAAVVQRFWSQKGPGSHRLGWDSPSPQGSSAGPLWPADGVGHLGFTGCSLWIAPQQARVVVLLSNRIHPDVEGGAQPGQDGPRIRALRALRPQLHQKAWELMEHFSGQ